MLDREEDNAMKKNYQEATLELICFNDVIITSGEDVGDGENTNTTPIEL